MFDAFADNERVMGQISYIRMRLSLWFDLTCGVVWCGVLVSISIFIIKFHMDFSLSTSLIVWLVFFAAVLLGCEFFSPICV